MSLVTQNPERISDKAYADSRHYCTLNLHSADKELKVGQEIEIPFTSTHFTEIGGFQFGLNYNKNKLALLEIIPEQENLFDTFAFNNQEDGILKVNWFDKTSEGQTFHSSDELFKLKFVIKAPIGSLKDVIKLEEKSFKSEATTINLERKTIKLNYRDAASTKEFNKIKVYPITPNPFNRLANIPFELPFDNNVTITIVNQNMGKW